MHEHIFHSIRMKVRRHHGSRIFIPPCRAEVLDSNLQIQWQVSLLVEPFLQLSLPYDNYWVFFVVVVLVWFGVLGF